MMLWSQSIFWCMVKDDLSEDLKHLKSVKTMLNMSGVAVVQLDGLERSRMGKLCFLRPFGAAAFWRGCVFTLYGYKRSAGWGAFPLRCVKAVCMVTLDLACLLITAVSDRSCDFIFFFPAHQWAAQTIHCKPASSSCQCWTSTVPAGFESWWKRVMIRCNQLKTSMCFTGIFCTLSWSWNFTASRQNSLAGAWSHSMWRLLESLLKYWIRWEGM